MPIGRCREITVGALVSILAVACGPAPEVDESVETAKEQLNVSVTRHSISYEYAQLDLAFPAGVAGGRDVVFVGSPFEGRVVALSRLGGEMLGELPAPPAGFVLPFILKGQHSTRITVLDAGGFPSPIPFIPANPTLYEYDYSYGRHSGFSAHLVRSISFADALIGFSEDAIRLSDGRYLVNDAVLGSIWIAEVDGTIRPGIIPRTWDRADAIPEMVFCDTMPLIEVGGIPFLFTASTIPGITSMAVRNGMLYFSGSCAGAVYSVPLASLSDAREPHERAADIRLVSRKPAHALVEELLGLSFNTFDARDPYLYAADALQLQIIRINTRTGRRETVARDGHLLNFPSSLAFLPPLVPGADLSTMVVVSNQQHRTPLTNGAITEDMLEPPFIATKVLITD
jgi:hypothetical protein